MTPPLRLLLIEDNEVDAALIRAATDRFVRSPCQVSWCPDLTSGLESLAASPPDVILADLSLPETRGLETVRALVQPSGGVPLIVLTGTDDDELARQSLAEGAQDYLVKEARPDADRLERALHYAVERQQLLQQVLALSLEDALTGLLNRRGLQEHLEQQLGLSERAERPLVVFCADLDGLKRINDVHGHAAGDAALQAAAQVLRRTFRDTDLLARTGGDEFVMVPLACAPEDAQALGERLDAEQARAQAEADRAFAVQLSWGSSVIPPGGDVEAALREADQALYRRKGR